MYCELERLGCGCDIQILVHVRRRQGDAVEWKCLIFLRVQRLICVAVLGSSKLLCKGN